MSWKGATEGRLRHHRQPLLRWRAALEKKPQTINIADSAYPLAVKLVSTSIRIFGGWKVDAERTRSARPDR